MKLFFRLILVTAFLTITSSANAYLSTYFDFNTLSDVEDGIEIPSIVGDGITGEFEELQYEASTTSIITGTSIIDSGSGTINALLDLYADNTTSTELDNNTLNTTWGIEFNWTNLSGVLTSAPGDDILRADYTGGDISFYLNEYNPDNATLIDQVLLAEVSVTGGGYTLDLDPTSATYLQGPYTILGVMDVMIDDFWLIFGSNFDIANFQMGWLTAETQGDNNDVNFSTVDEVTTITSNHNSSFRLSVVPEPTTLLLFGFGLLGIAGTTRRKR